MRGGHSVVPGVDTPPAMRHCASASELPRSVAGGHLSRLAAARRRRGTCWSRSRGGNPNRGRPASAHPAVQGALPNPTLGRPRFAESHGYDNSAHDLALALACSVLCAFVAAMVRALAYRHPWSRPPHPLAPFPDASMMRAKGGKSRDADGGALPRRAWANTHGGTALVGAGSLRGSC